MLTEISWWGGLLFIWWAGVYRYTLKGHLPFESFDAFVLHSSYISSAVLLALYFYPLDTLAWQYGYLICLGVAVVSFVASMLLPDDAEENGAKNPSTNEATEETVDDEETGFLFTMLGNIIAYGPNIVPCMLAAYKSWEIIAKILRGLS